MTNRLALDFSLTTNQERVVFIQEYLQQPQFTTKPPTAQELETIANYILWGKDPVSGLNAQQEGLTPLFTKHGTWFGPDKVESLDGLLEQPQFNEASLHPLDQVPLRQPRQVFSRRKALAECPPYMVDTFTDLFARIDHLDLVVEYWDLMHGKRKNPIRPTLLNKFSSEEQATIEQEAASLNQSQYLARRHLLVDLRREQYILRDQYAEPVVLMDTPRYTPVMEPPVLAVDVPVLPLGLVPASSTSLAPEGPDRARSLVFVAKSSLVPASFNEEELAAISSLYWDNHRTKSNSSTNSLGDVTIAAPNGTQLAIDMREVEHVYQVLQQWCDLTEAIDPDDFTCTLPRLLATVTFYAEWAELDGIQQEIFDMKVKRVRNVEIAGAINAKWGKSYTPNYVSTIFRQKIIPKICEAAKYHEKVVGSLFFEEEFKACKDCGRVLLLDPCNFTRSSRSKTGYGPRCKACESLKRKRSSEK